jgi:hypothetical protein
VHCPEECFRLSPAEVLKLGNMGFWHHYGVPLRQRIGVKEGKSFIILKDPVRINLSFDYSTKDTTTIHGSIHFLS